MRHNTWIASIGTLFLVLLAASVLLAGEPPDPSDNSAAEVIDYYVDEEERVIPSAVLLTLAGAVFVVFAATIGQMLRGARGDGGSPLPTIAIAGATIFATGLAASGALAYAAADLADEATVNPETITTINAIGWDFFFPFAAGILLFFLATGIEIVRGGALPKWLGWIAITIGVVALSPIGFSATLAGAAWVLVASAVIGLRAKAD